MADTTRLDKFSSTFLKADGDLLDKSVQRRHLAIDILKGDTGATGATGATGPTGPKGDTGASSSSQLFTSSGTFTAPAGVTKVLVTMIGGGGSGGGYYSNHVDTYSAGGGGAGGDYVWKLAFTVVPASNYTVTVGVGGVAAGEGANGNTGGNTTFDTVTVSGGPFGYAGSGGTAGNGGVSTSGSAPTVYDATTVTLGTYILRSGKGGNGNGYLSGAGGCSPFGLGGASVGLNVSGNPGTGLGSGGSGCGACGAGAYTSGAGTDGFVLVEW